MGNKHRLWGRQTSCDATSTCSWHLVRQFESFWKTISTICRTPVPPGEGPPPPSACGHKTGMLTNTGTLGSWGSRHHVVILFQVQASVCAIIAVSTAQIHDWSLQDNCCKIKVLSFAMPNGIIWNKGHLLTDSYSWPISAIILHYLNCWHIVQKNNENI